MLYALIGLVAVTLAVYSVLDVLRTPADQVRALPKPLWALVALLPLVGGAAWLLAGRPPRSASPAPRRPVAPPRPPDDDEEFLRQLRRRAEEQRRRAQQDPPPDAPA